MATDGKLIFIRPHDGNGRLVFGDDSEVVIPQTEISIVAGFEGESDESAVGCVVQVLWDPNVSRGEAVELRSRWEAAEPVQASASSSWQDADGVTVRTGAAWQQGDHAAASAESRGHEAERRTARAGAAWQQGDVLRLANEARWQEAERRRGSSAIRWQDGDDLRETAAARWQEGVRMRRTAASRWQQAAEIAGARAGHSGRDGLPVRITVSPRWQDAARPPAGLSVVVDPVSPPQEPCYDPETLGRLEFTEPWTANGRLVFVCIKGGTDPVDPQPGAPLYILPARYYMVVHDLRAHRLPDLTEIPVFNVSMGADRGSFGWSFEASVPEWAYDAFAPTSGLPAQIRITLDGIELVFCVTGRSFDNSFGTRSVRLSGVSLTTLLARPYSREKQYLNTSARTAQQLAIEALEFTGFSLDWGLTDWLVGAGAWSHTGSPLAAVQAIVEAAGGYLQSHRSAATILARHPYPELAMTGGGFMTGGPWNWGLSTVVPDVEIAPDALATIGVEWQGGNDLNAVYVSGVSQGVSALVKREYTAGEKLSTPVSDPLITAVEAARQRGLSILGAAGAKESTTYSLPLLTGVGQPGLLDVGQLVQVNVATPWRGLVRSVRASATYGGAVRQAVQIERHLEST